jgi:hypothetical protein
MSTALRIRGDDDVKEQPGSPHLITTGTGTKTTRTWRGGYAKLAAFSLTVGTSLDGSLGKIDSVELVPDRAGKTGPGTLTVVLADDEATYEIDAGTLEKPLVKHPIFAAGGAHALTDADIDKIETWKNAATSGERTTAYTALSANAKFFVDKLRRGEESYLLPAPIARKTTRAYAKPTTYATGTRGDPGGFPGLPAGYEWLKTGDKAIRQGVRGSWERVEEWTGAELWDHDIYPTA